MPSSFPVVDTTLPLAPSVSDTVSPPPILNAGDATPSPPTHSNRYAPAAIVRLSGASFDNANALLSAPPLSSCSTKPARGTGCEC